MSKKIILTDEQIAQVEALAAYLSIDEIADYLGISSRSFYEIKHRQPEVLAAYKRGAAKACSFVGSTLMGFIREKENTASKLNAATFYLRTKGKWAAEPKNDNQPFFLTMSNEQTPEEIFNTGFSAFNEGQIDFSQMQQVNSLAIAKKNIQSNVSDVDKAEHEQIDREETYKKAIEINKAVNNLISLKASSDAAEAKNNGPKKANKKREN